jgi:hypothetical protein
VGSPEIPETVNEVMATLSSLRLLTVYEVESIIENSSRMLLKCLSHLLPTIQTILNASLREGMPKTLKSSLVIPLIKKNVHRNVLLNYRPVSNLSFLSKTVERAAYNKLINTFNPTI